MKSKLTHLMEAFDMKIPVVIGDDMFTLQDNKIFKAFVSYESRTGKTERKYMLYAESIGALKTLADSLTDGDIMQLTFLKTQVQKVLDAKPRAGEKSTLDDMTYNHEEEWFQAAEKSIIEMLKNKQHDTSNN